MVGNDTSLSFIMGNMFRFGDTYRLGSVSKRSILGIMKILAIKIFQRKGGEEGVILSVILRLIP